jgi:type I restriction enzyme S subunit
MIVKISDLGDIVTGKTPPTKEELNFGHEFPFITPGDLQSTKHILHTGRALSQSGAQLVKNCILPPDSICVSCIGNFGYTGMTTKCSVTNQQINSIVVNSGHDSDFVYYLMKSLWPLFKHLEGQSTTLSILNKTLFSNIEVDIPELAAQRSIAATLSCLDDKIELNTRIIANLEAQAQAIFKSWFVDFEPFQDGEFEDSELGMIPKGWSVGTLGEISHITSGKRPVDKSDEKTESFIFPIIGASQIMGYTTQELYSSKIIVTGRVGTHGIIQRFNEPCWPSDNTLVITSDYYEFVFNCLRGIDYKSLNRGSTQPLITQTDIKNTHVLVPTNKTLHDFENSVSTLMQMVRHCVEEIDILRQTRDALLPKLMSGEIEVPVEG